MLGLVHVQGHPGVDAHVQGVQGVQVRVFTSRAGVLFTSRASRASRAFRESSCGCFRPGRGFLATSRAGVLFMTRSGASAKVVAKVDAELVTEVVAEVDAKLVTEVVAV